MPPLSRKGSEKYSDSHARYRPGGEIAKGSAVKIRLSHCAQREECGHQAEVFVIIQKMGRLLSISYARCFLITVNSFDSDQSRVSEFRARHV